MQNDFNTELARFKFGRQEASDKRCLTDYVSSEESKRVDYIGAFVTNIGPGVRSLANEWNENGDYLNSHILQSLALESAEAFAELLHQKMRAMWSITDREGIAMDELFKTQYHGKRFSFGYPACPRLEDQATLWKLLEPEKNIQVQLTEEFMMDPEASVSALVFHHPEAKYFNLSDNDLLRLESRIASESESF